MLQQTYITLWCTVHPVHPKAADVVSAHWVALGGGSPLTRQRDPGHDAWLLINWAFFCETRGRRLAINQLGTLHATNGMPWLGRYSVADTTYRVALGGGSPPTEQLDLDACIIANLPTPGDDALGGSSPPTEHLPSLHLVVGEAAWWRKQFYTLVEGLAPSRHGYAKTVHLGASPLSLGGGSPPTEQLGLDACVDGLPNAGDDALGNADALGGSSPPTGHLAQDDRITSIHLFLGEAAWQRKQPCALVGHLAPWRNGYARTCLLLHCCLPRVVIDHVHILLGRAYSLILGRPYA